MIVSTLTIVDQRSGLNPTECMATIKGEPLLVEPLYDYAKCGDIPYEPSMREVLIEWLDAINFIKHPSHGLAALNLCYHLFTFAMLLVFIGEYFSLSNLLFVIGTSLFVGTIYNTVWQHRYCSHAAFTFKQRRYNWIFLLTNPLVFRDESFAIAHRIHHLRSDKAGDPYGPHLGWFGSYLAIESIQKLNTNLSEYAYESLKQSLSHIDFQMNDYSRFQKTASVETLRCYLSRTGTAQLLWGFLFHTVGGIEFLVCWYAGIFIFAFTVREFNWRGHGGHFRNEKKPSRMVGPKGKALNQPFYGFMVGEWHDNHHRCPVSANTAFSRGQIDLAFQFIKLMSAVGLVDCYVDASPGKTAFWEKRSCAKENDDG